MTDRSSCVMVILRTTVLRMVCGVIVITGLLMLASDNRAQPYAQKGDDDIAAAPRKRDVEEFMEKKLKAAQLTLEGVMTNRFQQIQDNAATMVDLSRHAAWKQMASPSYIQDTADFVSSAEFLNRMAASEDGEGTILAFNRLMTCCANCHQHVRTPRVAINRPPSELQLATTR